MLKDKLVSQVRLEPPVFRARQVLRASQELLELPVFKVRSVRLEPPVFKDR